MRQRNLAKKKKKGSAMIVFLRCLKFLRPTLFIKYSAFVKWLFLWELWDNCVLFICFPLRFNSFQFQFPCLPHRHVASITKDASSTGLNTVAVLKAVNAVLFVTYIQYYFPQCIFAVHRRHRRKGYRAAKNLDLES